MSTSWCGCGLSFDPNRSCTVKVLNFDELQFLDDNHPMDGLSFGVMP